MRYEKQILESFQRLGFQPRDQQVEQIDQICAAFLDEKVRTVVLSAPTGTGKSIIGAVTAETIHSIRYPDSEHGASFMLTATNVLAEQYMKTFGDETRQDIFHVIKGARNYVCNALSTPTEPQDAESCAIMLFRKNHMTDIIDSLCAGCEYQRARSMKDKARHLITNYSYYFIDRMYSAHPMPRRTVCIFDEAHLINDLFVEHNAVYVSENRIKKMIDEVAEHLKLGHSDVFKHLKKVQTDLVAGRINEVNYLTYLRLLLDTYNLIAETAKKAAEQAVRNASRYLVLSRLSKKYFNLGCKIDDLILFEYPHVFEYREKDVRKGQNEHELSVKPIFVNDMFEALDNAEFNLLMSATISEQYAKRTMTLPGEVKHIRLPPQFPKENKEVVFFKPQVLNYNTLKSPETVKRLCASVYQVVEHHTKKGERGIILCPSFNLVESVAGTLIGARGDYQVFEHKRGEPLVEILENFKKYDKGPAVLITPSGFEGVDLPGDLSRYQVIVKTPYASLGDKRIKHILDVYPDIYALTALMKLTQGAGRSVRSKDDHAVTYILDSAAQKLWTAKNNEWQDEFTHSFRSILQVDE